MPTSFNEAVALEPRKAGARSLRAGGPLCFNEAVALEPRKGLAREDDQAREGQASTRPWPWSHGRQGLRQSP